MVARLLLPLDMEAGREGDKAKREATVIYSLFFVFMKRGLSL